MKKSSKFVTLILLTGLALSLPACANTPTTVTVAGNGQYQTITPEAARDWLAKDSKVVLLDVRTAEEYAESRIPGSQLLPYDEIVNRVSELPVDKNTPIIVYCRTGRRSELAALSLLELGYTSVYDLGGIQDWPFDTTTG
jgi:phage shock protein E